MPDWAREALGESSFSGRGKGQVLLMTSKQEFLSNTFSYEGTLSLPIDDLRRIPFESRVGDLRVQQPGEVLLHVNEKLDIRQPD